MEYGATIEETIMRMMAVVLVALTLIAMAHAIAGADKVQNVGGDFGRMWLERLESNQAPEGNESDADDQHNQTEADPLSEDWLGITSPSRVGDNTNNTRAGSQGSPQQEFPYSASRIITPIHEIDASWNQSLLLPGLPEPDKNGLINGIPAEMYYSIGPAYFNF